ncbi:thioredoxin family protein [Galbibacter orientalis]|uniref:thioredoxin family protein n=1 Tax=Galbibacter orientalis TaxID=453852 RepID=UPI00308080AE
MKQYIFILFTFLFTITTQAQEIEWLTWSEAIEKVNTDKNPKKLFVDVYTDWCGWCKKMDKDTFNNPKVAKYMQENFYMIKMDAEGKEAIVYKNKTFKYIPQGKRGYHELAAALLQGKLSFPTVIFLNENEEILSPVPGYQKPDGFLMIAKYFGDDIYKDKSWKEYDDSNKS